jgi:hypothetical protein
MDTKTREEWFGTKLGRFPAMARLFGAASLAELETPEKIALINDVSAITLLKDNAPPVFLSYQQANTPVDETTSPEIWVHHPLTGIKLKEKMDKLGLECHLTYQNGPADPQYKTALEFVIDKLNK